MRFLLKTITICLSIIFLTACKEAPKKEESKPVNTTEKTITFKNKGHELVYNMAQKVGNYSNLRDKKDVVYTYTYQTADGKIDIATEKYIFDGEYSYGKYEQNHHQKTFPQLKGTLEQAFDGNEYWLKHNDKLITTPKLLKSVAFRRPTNFYWFAMLQKLLDPGLTYEYVGEKMIDNKDYDIVKVSFNTTHDKPKDIYQLYINKKTSLVDQFLFTVAEFGKMDTPRLMQLEYITVDGMLIPAKRRYKVSTWNADITDAPWTLANWENIKFNNGLTQKNFMK